MSQNPPENVVEVASHDLFALAGKAGKVSIGDTVQYVVVPYRNASPIIRAGVVEARTHINETPSDYLVKRKCAHHAVDVVTYDQIISANK